MRILLITAEAWNDAVYGNNVLTNWFAGLMQNLRIICHKV